MKKIIKKRVAIVAAIVLLCFGFYIYRKKCMAVDYLDYSEEPRVQAQLQAPLVKKHEPLTIHNETGAKVNAAFYNKRFKRSGSVIRVAKEKMNVARRYQAPYIAVSRNSNTLAGRIEKSVAHTNVRRARGVKIASKGHDLIVTPTSNGHRH